MENNGKPSGYRDVLRRAPFRRLWLGQVISRFGDGFYWLAIMLGVSQLTGGSIRAIGLVSILFLLPQIPIGLLGGPMVDRLNRRQVMLVSDVVRVFTTLACVLAYLQGSVLLLYAMALIQSVISGLFVPAKNAIIPQLVEERDLLVANTLDMTTQVAAMIFGPALAGITIERWGIPAGFVVDALTFLLSALFIWRMGAVPTLGDGRVSFAAAWQDLVEGVRFAVFTPKIRHVTLVVSVLFLGLGAVNVIWLPYLQRIFHVGPQKVGLVDAFQGLGMLLGTAAMGHAWVRTRSPEMLLVGGLFIVSNMFIALGLAPAYEFILVATFILGIPVPAAQASFSTIVQRATPPELMGRVGGSVGTVTGGAMLLSMALAATWADQIGLRETYMLCGGLGLAAVGLGLATLR
ncbi:MAG: MFS transporter [Chloroflexi bacterium]|nr:MFS transporter [Chloroflexota bacterium]